MFKVNYQNKAILYSVRSKEFSTRRAKRSETLPSEGHFGERASGGVEGGKGYCYKPYSNSLLLKIYNQN